MTTLEISTEGGEARAVINYVLRALSLDEEQPVSVTIKFDNDFDLNASGPSLAAVAEKLDALSFNETPTGFVVETDFDDFSVPDVPAEMPVESADDDNADDSDDASPTPTWKATTDDERPHTADNPAHVRPNTMEHVALGLGADYLLFQHDITARDDEDAFDAVGEWFSSTQLAEWDDAALEVTTNQVGNALYRCYKKGLVERERGSHDFTKGHEFAYCLNRAGAAEVERLGEIDVDASPAIRPQNADE